MKEYQEQIDTLSQRLIQLEMANQSLGEQNRLLEKVSQAVGTAAPQREDSVELEREPWQSKTTPAALSHLLNSMRRGNGPTVTEAEAAKMKPTFLQTIRHEYVTNLAFLLLKATGEPGSPAVKELEDYVIAQRANWFEVMLSMTTETLSHLLAEKQTPKKLFKESMVKVMQLQPDQIRILLEFRRQVQQELQELAQERREAALILSKNKASFYEERDEAQRQFGFLERLRACDKLKDTLTAERNCFIKMKRFCSEVLTPLQEARALVEGFPDTWLDGMMLTEYLEAEALGTKQEWLDSLEDRTSQQHQWREKLQQQSLQPIASSSSSWHSTQDTGRPLATPFEAGAQFLAAPRSSSDLEKGASVSGDPLEAFPSIPMDDLPGLEAKELDEWMTMWGAAAPRLELFG